MKQIKTLVIAAIVFLGANQISAQTKTAHVDVNEIMAKMPAMLDAQKQLEFQKIYAPLQTAQQYGQGITGLIAGYPQQTQQQIAPSPSALQTGLGAASTLAGIYKTMFPSPLQIQRI